MGIVSAMFRETKRLYGGGIGTAKVFPADRGTGQREAFSAGGDAVGINICLVARKKCILQKKSVSLQNNYLGSVRLFCMGLTAASPCHTVSYERVEKRVACCGV